MTDSAGLGDGAGQKPRPGTRKVVLTLLRVLGANVALLAIYYLLPLDRTSTRGAIALLGVGLSGLVVLIVFQVRGIIRAEYPVLRAVGALATSAPLFLLLFAGTYYVLGGLSASNFSESMTRTDALISPSPFSPPLDSATSPPRAEATRALVTGQMVAGIVIVGIGARIIVDAIKYGRQQQPVQQANAEPDADGG